MRRSEFFMPVLKENPVEAQIVSHRLMLRAGLVRQTSAGIYAWLPLGLKVLKKIEQIVREEQDASGAQEVLMPTLQSADLWKESGRYDSYGKEMLRITDRHDREMLYGPTNEEMITDIFKSAVSSYRDLPKNLYHIQWKFRDEIRPRFGVMRGREFLMKDNYSFDLDFDGAQRSYHKMFLAYLRTFARMGIKAIPMRADTGPIGGDLSHEFIVLAETGESEVFCDKQWQSLDILTEDIDYDDDITPLYDRLTSIYAATDEKHDPKNCDVSADQLSHTKGIEVGHIFYFGDKYSKAMNFSVQGADGKEFYPEMGSYGIGVSRLVGAIIEASHDDKGIIWPAEVSPFQVGLMNFKPGDESCDRVCDDIYQTLQTNQVEVLYDDTKERPGSKFATMDLIGLPWQIVVSPRGLENGTVELKNRASGETQNLSVDALKEKMAA